MIREEIIERYLDSLLRGDRRNSRLVVEETLQSGTPTNLVYMEVVWPTMVEIERLLRAERITPAQEHLATRINRTIVDQLQNKLPRNPPETKKSWCVVHRKNCRNWAGRLSRIYSRATDGRCVSSAAVLPMMISFLLFTITPRIYLLVYGTSPRQAASVRQLIDRIKEVNAQSQYADYGFRRSV